MYSGSNWTYSSNPREDEERHEQYVQTQQCKRAGTHRHVTEDGAYGMICTACGERYFREKAIFA